MEFYNQESKYVLKELGVKADHGLTEIEAEARRKEKGTNELKAKKKTSPIIIFLSQFKSFIIYILLFAVVISLISGEYIDSIVILIILIFNAVFGFIQEYKAEKAIHALRRMASLKATVIRHGKKMQIDARDIVIGDIILLEEGNKVPADARIISETELKVSEASLTGESSSVSKSAHILEGKLVIQDRKNMVFSGTIVTMGRATAVVTHTGMDTEIGKIAVMITEMEIEMTPLQKKLEKLGRNIALATIAICIIVFIVGILKDDLIQVLISQGSLAFLLASKTWLMTAVSLAVAAVPEGLPAIVTIALAIGVRRMVKRNALIRHLPSVETLGEATVICSDKTGTITRNQMTVGKAYTNLTQVDITGDGYDLKGTVTASGKDLTKDSKLVFKIGALCNNATLNFEGEGKKAKVTGDPTEIALLVSAEKAGLGIRNLEKNWKRIKEKPFDSIRKMMTTVNVDPNSKDRFVFTKGATENVLKYCDRIIINGVIRKITSQDKQHILAKNDEYASEALRVLGFAYKKYSDREALEKNLVFVGLQGMMDPPHEEVKDAIVKCNEAGIRVIMITGDNKYTAAAIANAVGIEGESMNGSQFERLSEGDKLRAIRSVSIFSRVEPAHKMTIVKILEEHGEVVAMTGDGVNDAPAIKRASLGIAMGISGTDVAKESSEMILLDDNFTSIVNSVEEGRGIYENIKKFVNYLLSCNLGEVLVIFFAILLGWPLPMTAIMILWLNLVTDGLPALALSVDPNPNDLMKKPPKKSKTGIISKGMVKRIVYISLLISVAVLGLFFWAMNRYVEMDGFLARIQTVAFTAIVVMELVRLQAIRSEYKLGVFSNKYLVAAVLTSILLQLVIIYTPLRVFFGTAPLSLIDWGMIISFSVVVLMLDLAAQAWAHRKGNAVAG